MKLTNLVSKLTTEELNQIFDDSGYGNTGFIETMFVRRLSNGSFLFIATFQDSQEDRIIHGEIYIDMTSDMTLTGEF